YMFPWYTRETRSQSAEVDTLNTTCFSLYTTLSVSHNTRVGVHEVTKTECMAPGNIPPIKRASGHAEKTREGRNATGMSQGQERQPCNWLRVLPLALTFCRL